jgi:iron complex transport system permease protein
MAPHLVRLAGVRAHALLVPAAALWGGTLLVGADVLARVVPSGATPLPVGAATAFLGAPFVIWLARSTAGAAGAPAARYVPPPSRRPMGAVLTLAGAALGAALVAGLGFGALSFAPGDVASALLGRGEDLVARVVLEQRLPRILVAAAAGAALATSGALLQGVVRNPLAAPEIVGVTSGAGAAALTALVAFPALPPELVPLFAFAGGTLAFAVVYAAAWKRGIEPVRLALVGLAVAALLSAVIQGLTVAAGLRVAQALTWLAGSTYARDWADLARLAPWLAVLLPVAWAMARRLDLLALGEEVPVVLGLPLERTRLALLATAVALASAAVAAVGTLSFAGLMGPHIARSLAGSRHGRLLPVTVLVGATLVVVADVVGRTLFAPREIPSGLVTAALGAPYFLLLLVRGRRSAS